jgi:putative ABC transport system substrate-binding protein
MSAVAALVAPVPLVAQRRQTARVGILHDSWRDSTFNAMIKRLGEFGWVEGRNLQIEFRALTTDPKWTALQVEEVVRLNCDVILANGTPAALAVKAHAPTTPTVFIIGGDPVGLGLVASLPRPGGHATGYMHRSQEIIAKQLSLLRELAPAARRIAVMFEAGNPSMLQGVNTVQSAAATAGITVSPVALRDWKDIDAAHNKFRREPVDGLIVMLDRITGGHAWNIVLLADQLRLPTVYGDRLFIENGAVVSYGVDWRATIVLSADYVARILGGVKPTDLAVQQPDRFELVVHMHKARKLGMQIPQSVLLQATEVIE